MKTLLVVFLSCFVALAFALPSDAAPIVLPNNSPIYFQYNNLEQVSAANNISVPGYAPATGTQGNWGVLNVSSIQNGAISTPHTDIGGGPVFFADDGAGGTQGQITGIFYGLQLTSGTTATGGTLDLFWHDAGTDTITANCINGVTCGPNAATVAAFTSGTFLARLTFASGILNGNPTVTLSSSTNPTINTSGEADGFANVNLAAGGAWAQSLNGDWFNVDPNGNGIAGETGETRDVRFSTFYNGLASWNGTDGVVGLRSNDPARVLTSVPEPSTLSLLGIGLVGVGFMTRRRGQTNS